MVKTKEDHRIPPQLSPSSFPKERKKGAQFEPRGSPQLVRVTHDCFAGL